jgi:histidinol-phosphate aminotransferase
MRYKKNIENITRYIINDIDRSGFVRLDKNEFNIDFPDDFIDELRQLLDSYLLQGYPSDYGTIPLAKILLGHQHENEILLTPGSDYALKLCYDALAEPDSVVGMPKPTYAMNEVYTEIADCQKLFFRYGDDFFLDREFFWENFKKVNIFVLANPNQPTGKLEEDSFIKEILDSALENNIWVIIDEAYFSFSDYTATKYINDYHNLIVTRSFSKSYGIAGLRMGAVISCADNIKYLAKALPVYSINSLALAMLGPLVKYRSFFEKFHNEAKETRRELIEFYTELGCRPFESSTNFVMVETEKIFNTEKYIKYLFDNGILIRGPWTSFPYRDAFRITCSTHDNIQKLKEITINFIQGTDL